MASTIPKPEHHEAIAGFLATEFQAMKAGLTDAQIKEFGAWLIANPKSKNREKVDRYLTYVTDNFNAKPKNKKKKKGE